MITRNISVGLLLAVVSLTGCMTVSQSTPSNAATAIDKCENSIAILDTDFPAGNVASCEATGSNGFTVTISPEDAPPINCSAWYAFRLTPKTPEAITQNIPVTISYEACGHRYWPKTSTDGKNWNRIPSAAVKVIYAPETADRRRLPMRADINVAVAGGRPVFVSAQEIIVPATYGAWIETLAKSQNVERWLLGKSTEDRDIPGLTIKQPGTNPEQQVVLVGRQHPPEITGALGMLSFVEALNAESELAKSYRARFETIVIPMLNPDGVVRGYWRHNTGGTDLNRDWGPFKQPETQLMDGLLKKIATDPNKQLSFFADFHSTQNDIFYTIPDAFPTKPTLFIKRWLARLQERMPDYKVNRSANANLTQANSKNYVYRAYGVPTVTYEMGDETDRELIRKVAQEAAIAMMETLLAANAE